VTTPAVDGYELVTVLDAPHQIKALLYRRMPTPDPVDPWAIEPEPAPEPDWMLDLDTIVTRRRRPVLTADTGAALADLTPSQRSALGCSDQDAS
jgi:hypothetical protein